MIFRWYFGSLEIAICIVNNKSTYLLNRKVSMLHLRRMIVLDVRLLRYDVYTLNAGNEWACDDEVGASLWSVAIV